MTGTLWVPQEMDSPSPQSVDRITPAGAITNLSAGLNSTGGGDGDTIITGPDGNLWFNDLGPTKAIARIQLQIPPAATTGAASAVTVSTATVASSVNPLGSATTVTVQYGTSPALGSAAVAGSLVASGSPSAVSAALSMLPAGTLIYYRVAATSAGGTTVGATQTFMTTASPPPPAMVITATVGNQRITLTTPPPSACTAKSARLSVSLRSTAIAHFHGTALHFQNAAFYLDRGVRHTRTEINRLRHGRRKKVTVTFFAANAVAHHLPVTVRLRLAGLSSRTHTLKVTLTYHEIVIRKRHRRTVTVHKSLHAAFRVC